MKNEKKIELKGALKAQGIIVISLLLMLFILGVGTASAWLGDYDYRTPIEIDGNTEDLTDYQVQITLQGTNSSAANYVDFDKVLAGGADIRITDSNKTTEIDFWIEEWVDTIGSESATILLEVPSLPQLGTKTVYVYYGKSDATSESDGDDTFEFFDDFTGDTKTEAVTFGVFSSVEYGMENSSKLEAAVSEFNSWGSDFVVDLGDFIDYDNGVGGGNSSLSLADLDIIEAVYDNLTMSRYYVFGNHDLDYISKTDFMNHTGKSEKYHSFDVGNYHFIILDACFTDVNGTDYDSGNFNYEDAYIPIAEQTWLTNDLANTTKKTFIFVEQHLAGEVSSLMINNAPDVRTILENSGKVLAVFHGHSGSNKITTLNSTDYYALRAMDLASPNAYAKVRIYTDDSIWIEGIGEQNSHGMAYCITDKWEYDGKPVVIVSNGILELYSNIFGSWDGITTKNFTVDSGVLEVRPSQALNTIDNTICGLIKPNMSGGVSRYGVMFSEDQNELRSYEGAAGVTYCDTDFPAFPYKIKTAWNGSTFWIYYDDTEKWTNTLNTSGLKIGIESYKLNSIHIDWIFVRKYASTEPTSTTTSAFRGYNKIFTGITNTISPTDYVSYSAEPNVGNIVDMTAFPSNMVNITTTKLAMSTSIILDGVGTTNLLVQMPNTRAIYAAKYDGTNCNDLNCTFTQSNGKLNFSLLLGSEHTLDIEEIGATTLEKFTDTTKTSIALLGVLAIVALATLIIGILLNIQSGAEIDWKTIMVGAVGLIAFMIVMFVGINIFSAFT